MVDQQTLFLNLNNLTLQVTVVPLTLDYVRTTYCFITIFVKITQRDKMVNQHVVILPSSDNDFIIFRRLDKHLRFYFHF